MQEVEEYRRLKEETKVKNSQEYKGPHCKDQKRVGSVEAFVAL